MERNKQLDGWRAVAVLGVMWLHWAPASWRGVIPFEMGLFYFLTLTGYLITSGLLKQEEAHVGERRWQLGAYGEFLKRRFTRILYPCYAAMGFAMVCQAPDILAHPWVYFLHVSNWHIAYLESWPSGTSHYWTLAIQVQFYLLWPWVIWNLPRKWRGYGLWVLALVAPVSRGVVEGYYPEVRHSQALSVTALDYFAIGGSLAVWMQGGWVGRTRRVLRWGSGLSFVIYAVIYGCHEAGMSLAGWGYVQQTFLAIAMMGLIAATQQGFRGALARFLEHRVTQQISRLSFGLYLVHTVVPLMAGYMFGFLWHPPLVNELLPIRLVVFLILSLGLAQVFWLVFEKPPKVRGESGKGLIKER